MQLRIFPEKLGCFLGSSYSPFTEELLHLWMLGLLLELLRGRRWPCLCRAPPYGLPLGRLPVPHAAGTAQANAGSMAHGCTGCRTPLPGGPCSALRVNLLRLEGESEKTS